MNWDGNKTNDYFLGLCDRQNPERYLNVSKHEVFDYLHDIALAFQDLYRICAQNAWTEERLLNALECIITTPTISKNAKKAEKYLAIKRQEAVKLKSAIQDKSFRN